MIVAARDEEQRIGATLEALWRAFPGARVLVADDGSRDRTSELAARAGAELAGSAGRRGRGKGGAMTAAATLVLPLPTGETAPTIVLCDGDLGESAQTLRALAEAVESGRCDLAVAAFARRRAAASVSRWASPAAPSAA